MTACQGSLFTKTWNSRAKHTFEPIAVHYTDYILNKFGFFRPPTGPSAKGGNIKVVLQFRTASTSANGRGIEPRTLEELKRSLPTLPADLIPADFGTQTMREQIQLAASADMMV